MSRPAYYSTAPARVAFVDPRAGTGVHAGGGAFLLHPGGRRARLNLPDLLTGLATAGVTRAYVTGGAWPTTWADSDLRSIGWAPSTRGHYVDTDDPRHTWSSNAATVELRRAAPWFGPDADPATLAAAWGLLEDVLRHVFRQPATPVLLASPTATGQQLWAMTLPRDADCPQLDEDTAALIRATSPQHRMEIVGHCYDGCPDHLPRPTDLDGLHYYDGRLMYAALLRELGTAPARRLTGPQTAQILDSSRFARVRVRVRFRVPDWWEHPGLLMTRHPDGKHWHAPDAPGYTGETWADSAELLYAQAFGWHLEYLEGLQLTPGRPLDTWRDRLLKARELLTASTSPHPIGQVAAAAVRAILLTTIGGFHSIGRDTTHTVSSPLEVPTTATAQQHHPDGRVTYRRPGHLAGNAARFARPELSAQVWSRAHARLVISPGATGFMSLPAGATVGMWGDALYLTGHDWPTWDDTGRIGAFRLKGTTPQHLRRPQNLGELNRIRHTIEQDAA